MEYCKSTKKYYTYKKNDLGHTYRQYHDLPPVKEINKYDTFIAITFLITAAVLSLCLLQFLNEAL